MLEQIEVLEYPKASVDDVDSLVGDYHSFRLKFGAQTARDVFFEESLDFE